MSVTHKRTHIHSIHAVFSQNLSIEIHFICYTIRCFVIPYVTKLQQGPNNNWKYSKLYFLIHAFPMLVMLCVLLRTDSGSDQKVKNKLFISMLNICKLVSAHRNESLFKGINIIRHCSEYMSNSVVVTKKWKCVDSNVIVSVLNTLFKIGCTWVHTLHWLILYTVYSSNSFCKCIIFLQQYFSPLRKPS